MKRGAWTLAFLLAGGASAFAQGIDWIEDYDKGLAQARAEGRPIFLVFYATW